MCGTIFMKSSYPPSPSVSCLVNGEFKGWSPGFSRSGPPKGGTPTPRSTVDKALVPQVRPKSIVKVGENVYVHELAGGAPRYLGRPGVFAAESGREAAARPDAGVLAAPFEVQLPAIDSERSSFVEIRDRMSRQLVTAIEALSPTNKLPGSGRDLYLAQRQQLQDSGVHRVEIDLIRTGKPMPAEPRRPGDYSALISRADAWRRAGFWAIGPRDRLPIAPVPLKSPDGGSRIVRQIP
jgi:hypothetical protein